MNILIAVDVILDLLVPEREFQAISVRALQKLNQNNAELFVASSCVDNVVSTLTSYLESASNAVSVFKDLLEKYQIRLLSVTGVDFSVIDTFTDFELGNSVVNHRLSFLAKPDVSGMTQPKGVG